MPLLRFRDSIALIFSFVIIIIITVSGVAWCVRTSMQEARNVLVKIASACVRDFVGSWFCIVCTSCNRPTSTSSFGRRRTLRSRAAISRNTGTRLATQYKACVSFVLNRVVVCTFWKCWNGAHCQLVTYCISIPELCVNYWNMHALHGIHLWPLNKVNRLSGSR